MLSQYRRIFIYNMHFAAQFAVNGLYLPGRPQHSPHVSYAPDIVSKLNMS